MGFGHKLNHILLLYRTMQVSDIFASLSTASRLKSLPDVKVLDVDILIGRRLPLAPQQEAFFGRCFCS